MYLYAFHSVGDLYARQPVWYRDLGNDTTRDRIVAALTEVEADRYRGNCPEASEDAMLSTFRLGADGALTQWQIGSGEETTVFDGRARTVILLAEEPPR